MSATKAGAIPAYEPVLQFWFGSGDAVAIANRQAKLWWGKSTDIDNDIRERFSILRGRALDGELSAWEENAHGRLALIILVDQFSRNIFRERAEAFTYDYLAQEWCLTGLDVGADDELQPIERVFFYLPLEHSESRVDQARAVALYASLALAAPQPQRTLFDSYLDFAQRHQAIIERFGRFPHRNQALERTSTEAELKFLQEPGSSF